MDVKVTKIYSEGTHAAFTTIMKGDRDDYYVAFREAKEHHYSKSAIKIIKSKNLKDWEVSATTKKIKDLRDPQFSEGGLYCVKVDCSTTHKTFTGEPVYDVKSLELLHATIIKDGKMYLKKTFNYKKLYWPWVIKKDFIIEYKAYKPGPIKVFYKNKLLTPPSFLGTTETDGIKQGKEFLFIERNDYGKSHMVRGTNKEWRVYQLQDEIHCPRIFEWKGKTYVVGREAASKMDNPTMCIWEVLDKTVKLVKTLPGCGDLGYPGVLVEKDRVLISYYHQGEDGFDVKNPKRIHKSSIYLAEVT